jgi:tetratricopeptide (TPR) repeat protein
MITDFLHRFRRSNANDKLAMISPAAVEMLCLSAFFDVDAIPEEIFNAGAGARGESSNSLASDPLGLDAAIGEAARHSLVKRNSETRTLTIDRPVRSALKGAMTAAEKRMWAGRAVRVVNRAFPEVERLNWAQCGRLIDLVDPLASLMDKCGLELVDAAKLMQKAGYYLTERGRYQKAERITLRSLDWYGSTVGAEDPSFAASLNNLGYLYNKQRRYLEAEPIFKRVLAIYENALGPDHPYLSVTLNNLACLYKTQGRYTEAELLYHRSLAMKVKALGPDHQEVATAVNNLALLYQSQEKYEEAEPLLERALSIYEKTLGAEHPIVSVALNNLGCLYSKRGKSAEAQPLFKRAQSGRITA